MTGNLAESGDPELAARAMPKSRMVAMVTHAPVMGSLRLDRKMFAGLMSR